MEGKLLNVGTCLTTTKSGVKHCYHPVLEDIYLVCSDERADRVVAIELYYSQVESSSRYRMQLPFKLRNAFAFDIRLPEIHSPDAGPESRKESYFAPRIPAICRHRSRIVRCSSLPSTSLLSVSEKHSTIRLFCQSPMDSSRTTI